MAVFLVVTNGLFFQRFFLTNQAMLRDWFRLLPWMFLLLAPAITMRSWAEEKKSNTIEFLLTLPIRDWEVVVGVANAPGMVAGTDILAIRDALERQYAVRDIALPDGTLVPDDVDTLLVLGPTDPLASRDQYVIDQFLMAGGSLLVLADGIAISPGDLTATKLDSKIGELLAQYGVRLNKNLVLDTSNELAAFRTDRTQFFAPYPFWVKALRGGFN